MTWPEHHKQIHPRVSVWRNERRMHYVLRDEDDIACGEHFLLSLCYFADQITRLTAFSNHS